MMNHPIIVLDQFEDDERIAWLFAIACGEESEPNDLTDTDREALQEIRETLRILDSAWPTSPQRLERLEALFYQKLAVSDPKHPWIVNNEVKTLGELVRINNEELPPLPEPVKAILFGDDTPLDQFTTTTSRSLAVSRSVKNAKLPITHLTPFLNWLNACLSALMPSPSGADKFVFTRRRHGARSSTKTSDTSPQSTINPPK